MSAQDMPGVVLADLDGSKVVIVHSLSDADEAGLEQAGANVSLNRAIALSPLWRGQG